MTMMASSIQTAAAHFRLGKPTNHDASTAILASSQYGATPQLGPNRIQEWLLAATLTARVTYFNRPWSVCDSSLYPSVTVGIVHGKRQISLVTAHQMAMSVLAETERRLWAERAREAQFLVSLEDTES